MPCHERLIPKAFHGRHWRSRELVQRSHHVCRACGWQLPLELVKVGSSSIQGHRSHLGSDLHCLPVPWTHGRHFENGIRVSTPPLVAGGKLLRSSKEDFKSSDIHLKKALTVAPFLTQDSYSSRLGSPADSCLHRHRGDGTCLALGWRRRWLVRRGRRSRGPRSCGL